VSTPRMTGTRYRERRDHPVLKCRTSCIHHSADDAPRPATVMAGPQHIRGRAMSVVTARRSTTALSD